MKQPQKKRRKKKVLRVSLGKKRERLWMTRKSIRFFNLIAEIIPFDCDLIFLLYNKTMYIALSSLHCTERAHTPFVQIYHRWFSRALLPNFSLYMWEGERENAAVVERETVLACTSLKKKLSHVNSCYYVTWYIYINVYKKKLRKRLYNA